MLITCTTRMRTIKQRFLLILLQVMKAYYVATFEKHTQCNVRQFSQFFHTSLRIATENWDKILFHKQIIIVMPIVKNNLNFLQFLKHLHLLFFLN